MFGLHLDCEALQPLGCALQVDFYRSSFVLDASVSFWGVSVADWERWGFSGAVCWPFYSAQLRSDPVPGRFLLADSRHFLSEFGYRDVAAG